MCPDRFRSGQPEHLLEAPKFRNAILALFKNYIFLKSGGFLVQLDVTARQRALDLAIMMMMMMNQDILIFNNVEVKNIQFFGLVLKKLYNF